MKHRVISQGKRVPFVWHDLTQPVKKLILKIDGKEIKIVIDKI